MKTSCCHSRKFIQEQNICVCTNERCPNYLLATPLKTSVSFLQLSLGMILVFMILFCFQDNSVSECSISDKRSLSGIISASGNYSKPATRENVRLEIIEQNILCPDQAYAQVLIESAHLQSYLFKKTNNLLGMRFPFKRKTSAVGIFLPDKKEIIYGTQEELKKYSTQNHYAVYRNWEDSILDYKYWQDECFKVTDKYLSFLGAYYAEDEKYIEKIISLTQKP